MKSFYGHVDTLSFTVRIHCNYCPRHLQLLSSILGQAINFSELQRCWWSTSISNICNTFLFSIMVSWETQRLFFFSTYDSNLLIIAVCEYNKMYSIEENRGLRLQPNLVNIKVRDSLRPLIFLCNLLFSGSWKFSAVSLFRTVCAHRRALQFGLLKVSFSSPLGSVKKLLSSLWHLNPSYCGPEIYSFVYFCSIWRRWISGA